MKLLKEEEIIIKKSRFIGLSYSIDSIDDAKKVVELVKEKHKKARHIPYAYKVLNTAKKTDDKEPSGTAGMPIYNILERKNLDNIIVLVARYYGGTKLGAGNLTRAYAEAANKVTDNL